MRCTPDNQLNAFYDVQFKSKPKPPTPQSKHSNHNQSSVLHPAVENDSLIPSQSPYIPFFKITPSYICGYYSYQGPKRSPWQKQLFQLAGLDKERSKEIQGQKQYTGEITPSARKKLQSACDLLFALAKKKKVEFQGTGKKFSFRIALITLTISAPQGTFSDRELKRELLEPFLRHFRGKGLFNYVWKAERQANGNLHFHILTDCYIDKTKCRDYWNKLQAKLGFIETFHHKHGHRHPNSTDCKAVKDEKGMTRYMLKYMLKSVNKSPQLELGRSLAKEDVGKVWDCSLNLKLKNPTAEPVEDWQFELMEQRVDSDAFRIVKLEHCSIYFPVKGRIWEVAPNFLAQRLISFLREVRNKGKGFD